MKTQNLRNKNLNQEHYQALCHSKHLKRLESIHKQMSYQMKDIQNFQKKTLHRIQHISTQIPAQDKENISSLPKLKQSSSLQHKENYILSKKKDEKMAQLMKQKKSVYISSKAAKKQNSLQFPNIRRSQYKDSSNRKTTHEQKKENNKLGLSNLKALTSIFVKIGAGSPTYKIYLEILPQKFNQIQPFITGSTLKYFLEISDGHSQGKSSLICLQMLSNKKFIIYLTSLTSPSLLSIRLFNQSLYKNIEKFHIKLSIADNSGIEILQNAPMQIFSIKSQNKSYVQIPVKIACKKIQKKSTKTTEKHQQQIQQNKQQQINNE